MLFRSDFQEEGAADSVERRLSGERSTYEIHLGQQGQGQGMSEADRGRSGVREVTKGQTLHSLDHVLRRTPGGEEGWRGEDGRMWPGKRVGRGPAGGWVSGDTRSEKTEGGSLREDHREMGREGGSGERPALAPAPGP